jgi:hypothetical protein
MASKFLGKIMCRESGHGESAKSADASAHNFEFAKLSFLRNIHGEGCWSTRIMSRADESTTRHHVHKNSERGSGLRYLILASFLKSAHVVLFILYYLVLFR